MTVSDLWKEDKREWDPLVFEGVLNPEDQHLARQLYLSKYAVKDSYEWAYSQDTNYSVRSGYWVATHVHIQDDPDVQPPLGNQKLKQEIWRVKIAPKIQHFLWRCVSGALATATQLQTRQIPANPICQRCCQEDETINHILFTCPFAQAVWRCTSSVNLQHVGNSLEDNLQLLLDLYKETTLPPKTRLLPLWMLWKLWRSRNEFLFRKINKALIIDAQCGVQEVDEWIMQNPLSDDRSYTIQRPLTAGVSRNRNWSPPPRDWFKCNFDSSYLQGRSYTGTGWIIRDCNGNFITAGCAQLQVSQSPLQAEAFGFLHALQSVWGHGFRNVWFESDCMELTNLINLNRDHIDLGTLLFDIWYWMAKHPNCSLGHVHREKNSVADVLSNHASEITSVYQTYSVPPIFLVNKLYYPFTD